MNKMNYFQETFYLNVNKNTYKSKYINYQEETLRKLSFYQEGDRARNFLNVF